MACLNMRLREAKGDRLPDSILPTRRSFPRSTYLVGASWERLSLLACGTALFVSLAVLLGWQYDSAALKSVIPGLTAMNPASACCFILGAVSLGLVAHERSATWKRCASLACAGLIGIVASVRLSTYCLGLDFGLDQMLFADKLALEPLPNRMAPNTALAFILFAVALITLDLGRTGRLSRFCAGSCALIGVLTLVAYAYRDTSGMSVASHLPMALHTAALLLILGSGIFTARPGRGLMNLVTSRRIGGRLHKWLMLPAVVVPFVIGWLRVVGQDAGLFDVRFGTALFTVFTMVALSAVIGGISKALDAMDDRRTLAERQLQEERDLLEGRVRERTIELEHARNEILERLALAGEFRDDDTGEHTKRVGETSRRIALEIGMDADEAELLGRAALLHDIGKIGVSDLILLKPGRLSEEEFALMKQHTQIGAGILAGSESHVLQLAEQIARTHHEKWDGTGYLGMKGEEIPLPGRIVAVADVFDALTSERTYKRAWPRDEALNYVRKESGRSFDPTVVKAFFRSVCASKENTSLAA